MKVMKGIFKGIELVAPPLEGVRPTVDHFKKHILRHYEKSQTQVWDLFAGSGGVGIELISQGAKGCVFVEQTNRALSCLKLNLAECQLRAPEAYKLLNISVVQNSVEAFLENPEALGVTVPPQFVFLDPPYGQNWMHRILPSLLSCRLIGSEAVIIAEHVVDDPVPSEISCIQEVYGPKVLSRIKPG